MGILLDWRGNYLGKDQVNMTSITPVILAGGQGDRLWPLSRNAFPKQFTEVVGSNSLFQQTVKRLSPNKYFSFREPIVVTNENYRFFVNEQLGALDVGNSQIILEPIGRNTAPAIIASCIAALEKDKDATLLVMPSDHIIDDTESLHQDIQKGCQGLDDGNIVLFGIKPNRPETGFGYLQLGKETVNGIQGLLSFIEKPSLEDARKLVQDNSFLWNSGIFLFKAKDLLSAASAHCPEILRAVTEAVVKARKQENSIYLNKESWSRSASISIDYAVMEKIENLCCIQLSSPWSDLGEWNSVWEHTDKDDNGISAPDGAIVIDCENVLLRSEDKNLKIAAVGLSNVVVTATTDAVLIADRHSTQKVKQVVSDLTAQGSTQASSFRLDRRPWGWYDSLEAYDNFQVKHIHVNPHSAISLQKHRHRSEHWVIVSGIAMVTVNERRETVKTGESVYIPKGAVHRIENLTDKSLVFIEVQCGDYLGEDDIERFEDLYDRS